MNVVSKISGTGRLRAPSSIGRLGLRWKVVLAAVSFALIPLLALGFFLNVRSNAAIEDEALRGLEDEAHALQAALNPHSRDTPEVQRFGSTFRPGDKVMQVENDYDKEVFNGDIGFVRQVDADAQEVVIEFDGRDVEYGFGELDEVMPAWAVSVHKSQGSEYPAVVIPLHTQHYALLQRNLLYTAVTRGRKLVVVIGSRKAMELAAGGYEEGVGP